MSVYLLNVIGNTVGIEDKSFLSGAQKLFPETTFVNLGSKYNSLTHNM